MSATVAVLIVALSVFIVAAYLPVMAYSRNGYRGPGQLGKTGHSIDND